MKKIKPDDYYNNGIFEMARYGEFIEFKNNMPENIKNKIKTELSDNYEETKNKINETIEKIKNIVKKQNSVELLKMATFMSKMNYINIYSELQIEREAIIATQALKYIQATIVSQKNENIEKFEEGKYYEILNLIEELYVLLDRFIISYCIKFNKNNEEIKLIEASFLLNFVDGKRYSFQEIIAIKELLYPYKEIFYECFKFDINLFFDGMEKIQHAFTHGLNDNIRKMDSIMKIVNLAAPSQKEMKKSREVIDNLIGLGLHNVSKITNWPKEFIHELSYEIGECKNFFDDSEYSGWPIFKNPLRRKPFIILNGSAYCLSIQDLFDNIYRIILKIMRNKLPEKSSEINHIQGETAEFTVGSLFKKIIPDSKVYISNYYHIRGQKEMGENDLIITYDNNLILVEVKSGAYTPDFAIENFESNIKSIKSLIEKADNQNKRTLEYFYSREECPIYDSNNSNKEIKTTIKIGEYKNIIKFCITVDSFNEIEAQAEKIKYCNLNDETIVISLDDFRVYAEYFSSPTKFFHYIEQRKRAISVNQLELKDELDHLGMYIEKNMYSLYASKMKANKTNFYGFREELDKYFQSLYLKEENIKKPEVRNPKIIEDIIKFCDKNHIHNSVAMTNYLLDICIEDKEELNNSIEKLLKENKICENPKTIFMSGEYSLLTFIHKGTQRNLEEERNHSIAVMKISNIEKMLELHLFFNIEDELDKIEFNFLNINDIEYDKEKILNVVKELKEQRLKRINKKKIGRNEKCPCGSGKKYKKCCGKNE